eukprot:6463814-Amphidinium_carterae.1
MAAGVGAFTAMTFYQLNTRNELTTRNVCVNLALAVPGNVALLSGGVAFGSPVGGVLFSLEESSIFPSRTLLRSFIASVAASAQWSLGPCCTNLTQEAEDMAAQ